MESVFNGYGDFGDLGDFGKVRRSANLDRARQRCDAAKAKVAAIRAKREIRVDNRGEDRRFLGIRVGTRDVDNRRVANLQAKADRLCTYYRTLASTETGQRQIALEADMDALFMDLELDLAAANHEVDATGDVGGAPPAGSAWLVGGSTPLFIAGGLAVAIVGVALFMRRR